MKAPVPSSGPVVSVLRPALVMLVVLTIATGLIYPLLTTGLAQWFFPDKAHGSIIERNGKPVGSLLIGQSFTSPRYFWGRPSVTVPMPYNAMASGGSNLGPDNATLADAVRARIGALHAADPGNRALIPVDLISASGSGLDPHISPAAAHYQVGRVARARGVSLAEVERLIVAHTSRPPLSVLGPPVVNVLALNLALDRLPGQVPSVR